MEQARQQRLLTAALSRPLPPLAPTFHDYPTKDWQHLKWCEAVEDPAEGEQVQSTANASQSANAPSPYVFTVTGKFQRIHPGNATWPLYGWNIPDNLQTLENWKEAWLEAKREAHLRLFGCPLQLSALDNPFLPGVVAA
jgi:hypothetical protein